MDEIVLFEEYRLVERHETEINGAWKGAHLLLFFLAFIFGSFCTFCFNMVMYMFDENCVLFPKLLSISRHNIAVDLLSENSLYDHIEDGALPVDFINSQWADKNTCYLPTYVPLVSGIFGLIWTAMFLMFSTGSQTTSGMQRPWRVLPPVFLFSLAMGGLCVYTSIITYSGLEDLCAKLGQFTGSTGCAYVVNVATLAYERRIRGVYQATRLAIYSAWLHTSCWLMSALLVILRVFMVVDFQLVRVRVELQGNIENMLQRQEKQIRSVSPDDYERRDKPKQVHQNDVFLLPKVDLKIDKFKKIPSDTIYLSKREVEKSEMSLVPEERDRLAKIRSYNSVPKDKRFIVRYLYDLINSIDLPDLISVKSLSIESSEELSSSSLTIVRQFGQEKIFSKPFEKTGWCLSRRRTSSINLGEQVAEDLALKLKLALQENNSIAEIQPGTSKDEKKTHHIEFVVPSPFKSELNLTSDMRIALETKLKTKLKEKKPTERDVYKYVRKKSNLKNSSVQTTPRKRLSKEKVNIGLRLSKSDTNIQTIPVEKSESEDTATEINKVNNDKQIIKKEKLD